MCNPILSAVAVVLAGERGCRDQRTGCGELSALFCPETHVHNGMQCERSTHCHIPSRPHEALLCHEMAYRREQERMNTCEDTDHDDSQQSCCERMADIPVVRPNHYGGCGCHRH